MSEALVKVGGVSKTYPQGSTSGLALHDLNTEVEAGEFTAFVGQSGSGKTTLLSLIGTLDTPDAGEVLIGDESQRHAAARMRRRDRTWTPASLRDAAQAAAHALHRRAGRGGGGGDAVTDRAPCAVDPARPR